MPKVAQNVRRYRLSLLMTGVMLSILLVVWGEVNRRTYDALIADAREAAALNIAPYAKSLSVNVQSRVSLLDGLQAFAEVGVPLEDHFETYAQELISRSTSISNISIAPLGIQKHVYPLLGNETVPGHNILADTRPHVQAAVSKALNSKNVVLSGPYELRQGGIGLVARRAVFEDERFWGFVTMVIDIPQLMAETGSSLPSGLLIAVRDNSRRVFYGDEAVFDGDPVTHEVLLPDGKWEMAAIPLTGWHAAVQRDYDYARTAGMLIVMLATLSLFLLVNYQTHLRSAIRKKTCELLTAYDATIEGWSTALELRDKETVGHAQRVTAVTVRLAEIMGISSEEIEHVRRGALLHDIGKMAIPDRILHKPGRLNPEETAIMQQHPLYARKMLSTIEYLKPAIAIPYHHHERWDGSGYPLGLREEEIPLAARIFAVADVFDALTSDRPYRKAWPVKEAIEYICENSGADFDPQVVDIFVELIGQDTLTNNSTVPRLRRRVAQG